MEFWPSHLLSWNYPFMALRDISPKKQGKRYRSVVSWNTDAPELNQSNFSFYKYLKHEIWNTSIKKMPRHVHQGNWNEMRKNIPYQSCLVSYMDTNSISFVSYNSWYYVWWNFIWRTLRCDFEKNRGKKMKNLLDVDRYTL